jgi:hypothetical protein
VATHGRNTSPAEEVSKIRAAIKIRINAGMLEALGNQEQNKVPGAATALRIWGRCHTQGRKGAHVSGQRAVPTGGHPDCVARARGQLKSEPNTAFKITSELPSYKPAG